MTPSSRQNMIRVLLVGKYTLIRTALAALLRSWEGIEVIGVADPDAAAVDLAAQQRPDIVILQIDSGHGTDGRDGGEECFQFMTSLREDVGKRRVLVITDGKDPEQRLRAVLLGAVGMVLEDQAADVLERAIHKVHAGEAWLERTVTAEALIRLSQWRQGHSPDPGDTRIQSLTERERNVIALVCGGLQNREIGQHLSISEATVRHHLTSIFEKLHLQNRLELVIFACRDNADLLDPSPQFESIPEQGGLRADHQRRA